MKSIELKLDNLEIILEKLSTISYQEKKDYFYYLLDHGASHATRKAIQSGDISEQVINDILISDIDLLKEIKKEVYVAPKTEEQLSIERKERYIKINNQTEPSGFFKFEFRDIDKTYNDKYVTVVSRLNVDNIQEWENKRSCNFIIEFLTPEEREEFKDYFNYSNGTDISYNDIGDRRKSELEELGNNALLTSFVNFMHNKGFYIMPTTILPRSVYLNTID